MTRLKRTVNSTERYDYFSMLMFGVVFCDSLITYFGSRIGGVQPALIVIILFVTFVLLRGFKSILPTEKVIAWLSLMLFGFVIGIITAPDIGLWRLPQLISASIAFFIGYNLFRYITDVGKLYWLYFILSFIYISVCVIAVLRIAPHYFPIEVSLWAHGYSINERPAITTDQNFQFFYIFLPVLLIMLPASLIRFLGGLVLILGAAFILVRLQTRSGVLVFAGGLLLALAYPFVSKRSDKKKVVVLIALGSLFVLLMLPLVMHEIGPLLTRFLSEGREHETSAGRLTSALYIFDIVWNPLYWIPQGNPTYLEGANKPHSNIAAIFLEAGILGLVGWFMLFVRPVFLLAKYYYSRNSDVIASTVFVASVMVLILQLSLNVPVMDQIWLWAGALNGVLERVRHTGKLGDIKNDTVIREEKRCLHLVSDE